MTFVEVLLLYICPSMGGLMSSIMFAAPVNDLRQALSIGRLGHLNPFPFAMMSGNCLGWLIYGYYTRDAFIVAANLPGFILSIWLNMGAAKLQYLEMKELQKSSVVERHQVLQRWDADHVSEDSGDDQPQRSLTQRRRPQEASEGITLLNEPNLAEQSVEITPQETLFLRVLVSWAAILIYTSWLYPRNSNPAGLVGVIVNLNLVVFYGAPLKTIQIVIEEKNSASIHYETMIMNWINTSFWIGYGCARRDLVIVIPNATGLMLGIAQGILCLLYPRRVEEQAARLSLREIESDLGEPEDTVPVAAVEQEEAKSQSSGNAPELV